MVQGDGRLHKEDVERWYREMVNYIKNYVEMRWYRAMVNYIKKIWRDGIGQGDGKLHKEDGQRWC